MNPRPAERGQSLVLAAILMTVLVGFTGLAIDGGEATTRQQLVRSAADGAALAASYSIAVQASTLAAATTAADNVLTADALPTSDLTLSFLDSSGAVTATPSLVATVRAVVADSGRTFFLGAVGIPSISLSASADSSTTPIGGGGSGPAGCAICLMKTSGTVLNTGAGAGITLSGPLQVNSNGNPAVQLANNVVVTATKTLIPSGGTVSYGPGASLTPAPTVSPAIGDPYPTLTAPSISGAATAYTAPAGTPSISAGLYSTITVGTGSTLTLNPGTYVVTGSLTLNGSGAVNGSGVTIYLACPAYPTPCASGASGAVLNMTSTSTSISLSPPGSGADAGITIFGDRNNAATSTVNGTAVTISGSWYALAMNVHDTHSSSRMAFGQLVIATLNLANNDVVTFAGASGGAVVGLSA